MTAASENAGERTSWVENRMISTEFRKRSNLDIVFNSTPVRLARRDRLSEVFRNDAATPPGGVPETRTLRFA